MKYRLFTLALVSCALLASGQALKAEKFHVDAEGRYVHLQAGNPYLPLWEHLPDGEPRVFEDPDHPGRYRAYVIGSHDVSYHCYCGPDLRMWSAPVEDLTCWRDEGPVFSYAVENQWDIMYAPDLVEVVGQDGRKVYYLYPHSRGAFREPMVCRGDRPDGPFTPVNLADDGIHTTPGSMIGFDPSVFVEPVTDPADKDFATGFRAYAYWGYQHSTAAELDPATMCTVRPGRERLEFFLPASARYGVIRDPEGTVYPALAPGQNPGDFNFYEASSIRQVGNKYVMIFSGYSGPDYGLESTNSALRYCYADSPLGPWRSGGVAVDSRGVVPAEDGSRLIATNAAHNTHGSIQQINGQWYIFYHRPPRGYGFSRQAMVAPVKIDWDEKPVSQGGKVVIRAYDPYAKDEIWTARASNGDEYTGAEVTSEGFHMYGLDPYQYYSAGYACFMTDNGSLQDSWDIWDNHMDMAHVKNGDIIGYKYFGFGGLDGDVKGLKAFAGTAPGNKTSLSVFLAAETTESFTVRVMLDGPWANKVWKGKQIAAIEVPAGASSEVTEYTVDVARQVDRLDGKHALYLVAEGPEGNLFTLKGLGFNKTDARVAYEPAPKVRIQYGGAELDVPCEPIRFTNANGYTDCTRYELSAKCPEGKRYAELTASSDNEEVTFSVYQPSSRRSTGIVNATWHGLTKIYYVHVSE